VVTHAYVGVDASMTGVVPESGAASSPLASSVMMLIPPPSTVASSPTGAVPPESPEGLFKPLPPLLPEPPELLEPPELPELPPLDMVASGALPLLLLLGPVRLPSDPWSVADVSPVAHAEATHTTTTTSDPRWLRTRATPDPTEIFINSTLV
jgi:hypothetical protein